MATARFVVANDHFPWWFERRADQVALQTWHGTPLKTLGADVAERAGAGTGSASATTGSTCSRPAPSPRRSCARAFPSGAQVLETGLPRTDRLVRGDGARGASAAGSGVPDEARVVLYAPTYRDDARDPNGRYRLDAGPGRASGCARRWTTTRSCCSASTGS